MIEDLNSEHLHYYRKGEKKTYFVCLKVKLRKECKLLARFALLGFQL